MSAIGGGAGAAGGGPGAASEFEQFRPYLLRVAYSHLGSVSEAEDVVQEAWLRFGRVDRAEIRDLRPWLTTTVARLAIDALTSARARREQYVGTWLPEPVVESAGAGGEPAGRVTLDESVSMAMLVVLEALSPAERSSFLLHDVFGYSFDEVAIIVGRSPAACRQLATRARRRVEEQRPRYPASSREHRELVQAFARAAIDGDIEGLLGLLDPDVEFRSDGGGLVPAARAELRGADRVIRVLAGMVRHYAGEFSMTIAEVNGAAGLLIDTNEGSTVVALTVDAGRVRTIDVIRNPDKLRHVPR
jgi:RNA polymerase sigma-70 factor, ECF subfamily